MTINKLTIVHPTEVFDIEVGKPSPNSIKYTEIVQETTGWFSVYVENSKTVRIINPRFVAEVRCESLTDRKLKK